MSPFETNFSAICEKATDNDKHLPMREAMYHAMVSDPELCGTAIKSFKSVIDLDDVPNATLALLSCVEMSFKEEVDKHGFTCVFAQFMNTLAAMCQMESAMHAEVDNATH